ncbi:MAG: hypothetical protein JO166_09130 [Deltaproteobacteria bacterium]|nr:hypothetical protein [Deltaproteobacteria bacterium]
MEPTEEPIRFRGVAPRVDAVIPLDQTSLVASRLAVQIEMNTGAPVVMEWPQLQTNALGEGLTRLRLPLSESTPAGSYPGTLEAGGAAYVIEVQVHAYARLAISPSQLSVVAEPGGQASVQVTFVNRGNIAIALPRDYDLALVDPMQVQIALTGTVGVGRQSQQDRLKYFFNEAVKNSGVLKLEVVDDIAELAPGEERMSSIRLHIPRGLRPSHVYHALWFAVNDIHVVSVSIQAPSGRRQRRSHESRI